jgi:hypothetical protein
MRVEVHQLTLLALKVGGISNGVDASPQRKQTNSQQMCLKLCISNIYFEERYVQQIELDQINVKPKHNKYDGLLREIFITY